MIESNSGASSALFHSHVFLGEGHEKNERKAWAVIWLCGAMMIAEIVGGKHPPGYIAKIRQGKRNIALYFTQAEFDAVTRRAEQDGITKLEAGRRALLNYAKNGLTRT